MLLVCWVILVRRISGKEQYVWEQLESKKTIVLNQVLKSYLLKIFYSNELRDNVKMIRI